MTVTKSPSSNFNVPTVDLAPYLADPTSSGALKIVNQIREACISTGFFQLIGHGIPRSLQDEVFAGSEAFFKLPFEEKKKLDKSESVGASNRGYELIGNQGLQEGTLPDLKEVCTVLGFNRSNGRNDADGCCEGFLCGQRNPSVGSAGSK
jgi:isopenicillin N synthase-like dioxygenase